MKPAPFEYVRARMMVSEAWRATYPGACAGILVMHDVANPDRHPDLDRGKDELEQRLRAQHGASTRAELLALPVLQAYAAYYRRFGKTYHVQLQLESVALKGKRLPRVAALVEAMFMAELEDLLLTAGHDADAIRGPIHLDVASGAEHYELLSGQGQALKAGDMLMRDDEGVISSVLHGPDRRTRLRAETRRALFAVYAPPGIGPERVGAHLDRIAATVRLVAPGASIASRETYTAS
jgi:DNA/RNA-binding domain of Phe-tRNA-synthetase-like protein